MVGVIDASKRVLVRRRRKRGNGSFRVSSMIDPREVRLLSARAGTAYWFDCHRRSEAGRPSAAEFAFQMNSPSPLECFSLARPPACLRSTSKRDGRPTQRGGGADNSCELVVL